MNQSVLARPMDRSVLIRVVLILPYLHVAPSPHLANVAHINFHVFFARRPNPYHIIAPILDSIHFSLDYLHGLTAIWISMPKGRKTSKRSARHIEPAAKTFRSRDSGRVDIFEIGSPRAGRPTDDFAYTNRVVTCYRRYPQHRLSIVITHYALGILILSIIANWGSISRICFGAYTAISYLLEILLLGCNRAFSYLTEVVLIGGKFGAVEGLN